MRAATKGRSLRPRNSSLPHAPVATLSQPPDEPSAGSELAEGKGETCSQPAPAPPVTMGEAPKPPAPAVSAPVEPAPAEVRSREAARVEVTPKTTSPEDGSKKASPTGVKPASSTKGSAPTVEGEPGSRRPASQRAVTAIEDDTDLASISAEFFRKDEGDDSVPPVEEHEEAEAVPSLPSPSRLARRARLRRVVAGVVAFAGVVSIAVVGKQVFASKRPSAPAPAVTVAEPPHEAPRAAEIEPAKVQIAPRAAEKAAEKADDKTAEGATKSEDAKVDSAKKSDTPPSPSGGDAAALKKETLNLLNRGRTKDAIEKAREAIAADPSDATSYLYLGSALQDSGKWKDGIEAYSECVRHATKGPVNECRAMGGHK